VGIEDKVQDQSIIVTPSEAPTAIRQSRRMLAAAEDARPPR
jgi:hypothetical protein